MGTYQALVVENEEDVTQEYLAMPNDFLEYNDNHCIVFVKNTGNVYDCNIEEGEIGPSLESPYVFIKSLLKLITDKTGNKYYEIGSKIWFIILSDFDYSVDNTGESTILNGIGHYLDGTVYDYATGSNYVVPLVLTKGTDKRIGLNLNLFGIVDLTNAPVQIPEEDLVTKIDLSILQKHFTEGPVFAPYSETHTEISYWYYSNNEWVNMDESQGGGSGGVSYQLICNNREDLVSKSYRVDWSKLPDFIKNTFGINPDLTLGEIGDIEGQYATNSFVLQFPLAMEDNRYYDGGNSNYFNFENTLFFQLNFDNSGVAKLRSEGYLHGLLDFNVAFPYSTTLKEAILQLPTTTSGSSSGIYALLILGAITLTEISE